ncbi:ER membrane protein complex subunit 10 [Echinococcus granulosus]|nr:ER membrane protein complex subunit 10 [Echinococcus granulosus]
MGWVFLLASVLFIGILAEDDFSPLSVVIEHSFDKGKSFKQKGITLALDDSLYIIRAYTKPNAFVLMGSCPALYVIASNGQITLVLNIDASGSPIALSIVAKNQTSDVDMHRSTSPTVFSTMVSFQKPTFSIGPETQEYLAKMDRQREEKLRQDQADNRSFLAKYWMYILPAVFFFILLNSADQNTGGNSE